MVRGSLYALKGKCGKKNCHCWRDGILHETPALSCSVGGRTRILTLRPEDVPKVREALARYKKAQALLEAEALAGIESLRGEIHREKGRRG